MRFHNKKSRLHSISRILRGLVLAVLTAIAAAPAYAAVNIPITVNLSEIVTVTGAPRIAVDVGGTLRYATYTSGTGTNTLTFTLSPQAGDVDLDGVTVSSPIDLNGGAITDLKGNPLSSLTFTPPGTTNVKVNYPSLGLDFIYDADGRYTLNGTAYNDLTSFLTASGGSFTRASIGTYYDSTGTLQTAASGAPRFDYDPVTHTPKGILIEESRTNLATYSTRMDNAAWFFGGTKTTGGTAPDGSTNATYLSGPSAPTTASRLIAGAATATTMTYSVYAKYVSGGAVRGFLLRNSTTATNFNNCNFNLSTGSISSGCTGWIITSVGNGWYRLAYTQSTGITVGDGLGIYFGDTGAALVAGDSWLVWGAQLEAGAFATSFIPTTTATVTRAADSLKIPTGGWYNSTEGTVYVHGGTGDTGATSSTAFFSFDDNTSNNRIQLRRANGTMKANMRIVTASTSVMDVLGPTVWTDSSIHDFAIAYKSSDNRYYMDGVYQSVSISGSPMPTITQLQIGYGTGSNYLDGPISKLKYYPARINNTQLQLLTQ